MTETLARLVWSICAMAKAKNITHPSQLDTLVGKAARALSDGAAPIVAFEVARIAAAEMAGREPVSNIIDQLIEAARSGNGLMAHQAI